MAADDFPVSRFFKSLAAVSFSPFISPPFLFDVKLRVFLSLIVYVVHVILKITTIHLNPGSNLVIEKLIYKKSIPWQCVTYCKHVNDVYSVTWTRNSNSWRLFPGGNPRLV